MPNSLTMKLPEKLPMWPLKRQVTAMRFFLENVYVQQRTYSKKQFVRKKRRIKASNVARPLYRMKMRRDTHHSLFRRNHLGIHTCTHPLNRLAKSTNRFHTDQKCRPLKPYTGYAWHSPLGKGRPLYVAFGRDVKRTTYFGPVWKFSGRLFTSWRP